MNTWKNHQQEVSLIMKTCGSTLLVLATALGCAVAPMEGMAQGQTDVFLTFDPVTQEPTTVAEANINAPLHFKSLNYDDPANPAPFILTFGTDFIGKYSTGAGFTAGTVTGWGVVFASDGATNCMVGGGQTQDCQVVKIKLDSSMTHPPGGYKYDVIMNGKVLDPKVRPR